MKRYVVIDKSYLQGAKRDEIHRLCGSGAIMPDSLYAELLTTTPDKRLACFKKFPPRPSPVHIIPTIGGLMEYEMMTHSRCTPLIDRSQYVRFEFHEGCADGTYQFTESDLQAVDDIKGEMQEHMNRFRMASAKMEFWFPKILDFPANGLSGPIEAAMASVATDQELVRLIYGQMAGEMGLLLGSGPVPSMSDFSLPDPTAINENWAWFRFLQVLLVYALEFVRKNGSGHPGQNSESLEHDLFDVEYVMLGTLTGALASRDKTVKRFFLMLCPDGELVC